MKMTNMKSKRIARSCGVALALSLMTTNVNCNTVKVDASTIDANGQAAVLIPGSITIASPVALSSLKLPASSFGTISWVNPITVPAQYAGSYPVVLKVSDTKGADFSKVSGWDPATQTVTSYVTVIVESLAPSPTLAPMVTPTPEAEKEPAPVVTPEVSESPVPEITESPVPTPIPEEMPSPESTEAPDERDPSWDETVSDDKNTDVDDSSKDEEMTEEGEATKGEEAPDKDDEIFDEDEVTKGKTTPGQDESPKDEAGSKGAADPKEGSDSGESESPREDPKTEEEPEEDIYDFVNLAASQELVGFSVAQADKESEIATVAANSNYIIAGSAPLVGGEIADSSYGNGESSNRGTTTSGSSSSNRTQESSSSGGSQLTPTATESPRGSSGEGGSSIAANNSVSTTPTKRFGVLTGDDTNPIPYLFSGVSAAFIALATHFAMCTRRRLKEKEES